MKKDSLFFIFLLPFFLAIVILVIIVPPLPALQKKDTHTQDNFHMNGDNINSKTYTFTRGDSFFNVMHAAGMQAGETLKLVNLMKKNKLRASSFPVGTEISVLFDGEDIFSVDVFINRRDSFFSLSKEEGKWELSSVPIPVLRSYHIKEFTISSSLFGAIKTGGESDRLVFMIINVLKWDIDFFKDVRKNDKIQVLFEKIKRAGAKVDYGKIVAIKYLGASISSEAFYFTNSKISGYFDEKGNNKKKSFLKYPLKFSRISSNYSGRRFHPVLKVYRPHHGIDYAAPTGTPIYSIGDGVIKKKGWYGGAGRHVTVRHANGYESIYNHLSKYGRGIKVGTRVSMGRIIGYVGSSGLATGPHLDFRVKKNGRWINPLKMRRPAGKPLPSKYKNDYKQFLSEITPLFENIGKKETDKEVEKIFLEKESEH